MKPNAEAAPGDVCATTRIGLLLLVAAGVALRLPGLNESLWLDEAVTWLQTRHFNVVDTIILTGADRYPPLHNLLTLPFVALFGSGEIALRLPFVGRIWPRRLPAQPAP